MGKTLLLSSPENPESLRSAPPNRQEKALKLPALAEAVETQLEKENQPKKPKGIPIIIPNLSTCTFQRFCHYSGSEPSETRGRYSFLFHYSNGKRGPPGVGSPSFS